MLETLRFEIGGFEGYTMVTLRVRNERIFYTVETSPYGMLDQVEEKMASIDSRQWLLQFEKLQIDSWNREYVPKDMFIMDGTQWKIEYRQKGEKNNSITGDNAYPNQWNAFMELMDDLAPEALLIYGDRIEKVTMLYRHCMDVMTIENLTNADNLFLWDYVEYMSIDRKEEKISYRKNLGTDCVITSEFLVRDGVEELLENGEEILSDFRHQSGEQGENDAPILEITITRHDGTIEQHTRSYDRYGLPEYWDEFMKEVKELMKYYGGPGDMFDTGIYRHGVKKGEYIYCSVEFESTGKSYYYRTEDDSLQVGDKVVVPVGFGEQQSVAKIVEIEYFTDDTLPFPLEKTKMILRKYARAEGTS